MMGITLKYKGNFAVNKDTLKEYVQSVLMDADMKENIAKIQELIRQAPGNKGCTEAIIDYYKNTQSE